MCRKIWLRTHHNTSDYAGRETLLARLTRLLIDERVESLGMLVLWEGKGVGEPSQR